jgi:hypothetical protein
VIFGNHPTHAGRALAYLTLRAVHLYSYLLLGKERAMAKRGGTVIRGSDGTVYFIRDELLAKLAVDDEGIRRIEAVLEEGGERRVLGPPEERAEGMAPAASRAEGEILGYVSGDLLRDQPEDRIVPVAAAKSTYMCPWFCSPKPE